VKDFRWDPAKNSRLAVERGVTFERVVAAIEVGGLIDIVAHPNPGRYPRQRILVVAVEGYVYLVPFVEDGEAFFLKTVIPSRKATGQYLGEGRPKR
jgi:uncharacterized DUF497 family protein